MEEKPLIFQPETDDYDINLDPIIKIAKLLAYTIAKQDFDTEQKDNNQTTGLK